MTKKAAWDQIERFKDETNYYSGCIKLDDMRDMLRNQMAFGEAETEVILAALTIAGARFQDNVREVSEAWKKEKARKGRKAERLGAEMDRAIEAGDYEAFGRAYREAVDCMSVKERGLYWEKAMGSIKGRDRSESSEMGESEYECDAWHKHGRDEWDDLWDSRARDCGAMVF